jgi:sialic acid synthase SpsE
VPDIIRKVHNCWKAIGDAPARHREPRDLSVRKGLVAKRRIAEGEALGLDNVRFAWPPLGISVEHWDVVVTRCAARTLQPNEVIDWSDVRLGR